MGFSFFVAVASLAVGDFIPWAQLYNLKDSSLLIDARKGSIAFIACFMFSLPLGLTSKVQAGLQDGVRVASVQTLTNVVSLILLVAVTRLKLGLPWLVFALAGSSLIVQLANTIVFFRNNPDLSPRVSEINLNTARLLWRNGAGFLYVQLHFLAYSTLDTLLISHYLGAESVTSYSIVQRLFSLSSLVMSMLLGPFWAAFGEAFHRGDVEWVRKALNQAFMLGLASSIILSVLMVVYGKEVILHWTGSRVFPSTTLLLLFAFSTIASCAAQSHGYFLLSINHFRFTIVTSSLLIPVAVVAKMTAVMTHGVNGVVLAGALCQLVIITIPVICFAPRLLSATATLEKNRILGQFGTKAWPSPSPSEVDRMGS
jgi:O-antigen/teichoic acid export membrane protein